MKGDARVVADLNRYLSFELTGHRQYLLHAAMCRHWGFERLARIQDAYSAEETQHAARIAARILMLGASALPEELRTIAGAPTVPEQLALDRALVHDAALHLRAAVERAEGCADYVSRDLLREMLDDEERHEHWLDTEIGLVSSLGLENYLQAQLRD
ncbi:MAG: bacterioferritin [Proteobacteria bacterium]|nr:bacterioferritin [Pseudomonadota bacterium]